MFAFNRLCLLLILFARSLSVVAAEGQIPNQSYRADELFTQISPQLSNRHHNQPSVINGYVLLAGNGVHEFWDISDPYNPEFLSELISPHRFGEAESHQVSYAKFPDGSLYLVTASGRGIDIWDIGNVRQPRLLSSLQLPNISYGDVNNAVWGVAWQGDYIYVGATTTGVFIVDASNPLQPQLLNTIPATQLGGVAAGPLFALGNLLVVTTPKNHAGLATLDISNPAQPVLLDFVNPSGSSYIGWFYGQYAYLQQPLRTYDVTTDPANIRQLGSFSTPNSEYMSFGDGYLFLGGLRGGSEGIWKYLITDPGSPRLLGRIPGRDVRWDDQFSVPVGNLVVVSDDQNVGGFVSSFVAVHATQPDIQPPLVSYVNPPDGARQQALTTRIALSFSDQVEFASVDTSTLILRPLGGQALSGKWGYNQTVVTFWPDRPLVPDTTYEIIARAGGITDLVGNAIASEFRSTFSTGASGPVAACRIDPLSTVEVGQTATFSASSTSSANTYQWDFGDGNQAGGAAVNHRYSKPGRYPVTLSISSGAAAPAPSKVFEAEQAKLLGGVALASNHAGFSGSGFADYPAITGAGVKIQWQIQADSPGSYGLDIRYANGGGTSRPLQLVVNGNAVQTLAFPVTGGWPSWQTVKVQGVALKGGGNIIELVAGTNAGPNIDQLSLSGQQTAVVSTTSLQAENATLSGGVVTAVKHAGYTGSGFADYPAITGPGVKIQWQVPRSSAGQSALNIRYANGSSANRPLQLVVNGATLQTVAFPPSGGWSGWQTVTINDVALASGNNTVELVALNAVGPNIDQLTLNAATQTTTQSSCTATQVVQSALIVNSPTRSTTVMVDEINAMAWAVNSDSNTVSAVDTRTLRKTFEVDVGEHPVTLAQAVDRSIWVVNQKSSDISILDPDSGLQRGNIVLPYASQPYGIAFSPDGSFAYVSLQALGRVLKIDPLSKTVVASIELGPDSSNIVPQIRGIALSEDGSRLFATRFISADQYGEVYQIDPRSMTRLQTLRLANDLGPDTPDSSRGIPNYISSMTISPDGASAWIPSKKDNIERGQFRDRLPLTHDSTVRTIVSQLDLSNNRENINARIDLNDQDMAFAAAFSPAGDLLFVAVQGSNVVSVFNAFNGDQVTGIPVGLAPQGLVLDEQGHLYVQNFMGRSLSVFDVNPLLDGTATSAQPLAEIDLVANETLPPAVLQGKQIFYNAASSQMNLESYISCASCHLDGAQDGRTWDFTSRGEGLRNTISLRGRGGLAHGPLHWTGNFDEIQDFENDMRFHFGGNGFMDDIDFNSGSRSDPLGDPKAGLSRELDALAAYVASLNDVPASPYRAQDGSLTSDAVAGRALFDSLSCGSCHSGGEFTDSALNRFHDIGTISSASGSRNGEALVGFDTPTLKGVWATAPYLHDGSATTLAQAVSAHDGIAIGAGDLDLLVAYLQQIDDTAVSNTMRVEAEDVSLIGGVVIDSKHAGYSGRGFADYPGNTGSNVKLRWQVTVTATAQYQLLVRYANGGGTGRPLDLVVNGVRLKAVNFPATGAWSSWQSVSVGGIALAAGPNTLELVAGSSVGPNIDQMTLQLQ